MGSLSKDETEQKSTWIPKKKKHWKLFSKKKEKYDRNNDEVGVVCGFALIL